MNRLTDLFQPKCKHRHTARTHPKCFGSDGQPLSSREKESARASRVLVFDVETLPMVVYSWGVWQQNIGAHLIIKDWCILSWSAKWLHDDKIMGDVLSPKEAVERNDKRILESFWSLLDSADVVIAHNGKRFDVKKVNTRLWKHRMKKPSSYKVIDTLTSVKSVFSLNHNTQDSIAEFLELDGKLDTNFALWAGCDNGDPNSLMYMLEYNEQDVRSLENIYLEMREWIPNHPDLRIYDGVIEGCPVCMENDSLGIGIFVAKSKRYIEHRCNNCGAVWHDSESIKG